MAKIISNNQSAFLRGRNISDNTILIREVVHSFQSASFKKEAFLLKADVNKAFDMLSWPFVRRAMKAVNMPPILINLIMECMKAGKVTVLINGQGSGFLTPTKGLRQGCPMSPYIFILAMEFLTKLFRLQQQNGHIMGLKIARSAPSLTHSMYADDLIIMGAARIQEVRRVQKVLTEFGEVSSLTVNPDKSKIWFSNRCSEECRERIMTEFRAKEAGEDEKYLGIVITKSSRQVDLTHNMLLEKMENRLAGWKVNMLSFAGRVTLIKSVLLALPVYYMSIAVLPTKTTNEINSLLRKFLWGKLGKDRYMAMIAWHRICLPTEEGGLGIRDVKTFNDALVLKLVWQISAGKDKLWIQVMKAKYYPQGAFWETGRRANASMLWKGIQDLKELLKNDIGWHIGDGKSIKAVQEPWFQEWENQPIANLQQGTMSVADLYDMQRGQWREGLIQGIYGEQALLSIITTARVPK